MTNLQNEAIIKISEFHEKGDGMIITFLGHSSLYNCDDLLKKIKKAIEDKFMLCKKEREAHY